MLISLLPPSGNTPAEYRGFLSQLVEQINTALANIDESNLSATLKTSLTTAVTTSSKLQQLATLAAAGQVPTTANVRKQYTELRNELFSSVENVTASFDSLIEQTTSEIKLFVEANYMGAGDGVVLQEQLTSLIAQTAEQVRVEFSTMAEANSAAIEELSILYGTYFSFTTDGLEIGETGAGASEIVTRVKADRIEFAIRETDVVIAYINAATGKLHIANGSFERLVAGIPDAQRVEMGYNEAFEPFVQFYDNSGAEAMGFRKNTQTFGNGFSSTIWENGNEIGVGDFIE